MELIAHKNKWLTQATLENESERGFWKRMHLACSLSKDDFVEWTDAQKTEWETEHPVEEAI